MRSRARSGGYSLLELMVVVVIIAVVSALVLPGLAEAGKERRGQQAAMSVLDVYREARSRAMYRGMPQVVVATQVSTTAGSALQFRVFEANPPATAGAETNRSCRTGVFPTTDTTRVVLSLDLTETRYLNDGITEEFTLPTGTTYLEVCYSPLGTALFRTRTTDPYSNDATVTGTGGAFQVEVQRRVGGAATGARRRVVIPLGGNPRMRTV